MKLALASLQVSTICYLLAENLEIASAILFELIGKAIGAKELELKMIRAIGRKFYSTCLRLSLAVVVVFIAEKSAIAKQANSHEDRGRLLHFGVTARALDPEDSIQIGKSHERLEIISSAAQLFPNNESAMLSRFVMFQQQSKDDEPANIDGLLSALTDEDPRKQMDAARRLGEVTERSTDVITELKKLANSNTTAEIKIEAIKAIIKLDADKKDLILLLRVKLKDENRTVREFVRGELIERDPDLLKRFELLLDSIEIDDLEALETLTELLAANGPNVIEEIINYQAESTYNFWMSAEKGELPAKTVQARIAENSEITMQLLKLLVAHFEEDGIQEIWRLEKLYALQFHLCPPELAELVKSENQKNDPVNQSKQLFISNIIQGVDPKKLARLIIESLTEKPALEKAYALMRLKNIARKSPAAISEMGETITPAVLACLNDPEPIVRLKAIECWTVLPESTTHGVDEIIKFCLDKDKRVATAAEEAINRWFKVNDAQVAALGQILKGPSLKQKIAATRLLSDGGESALPVLFELMESRSVEIRREACISVAKLKFQDSKRADAFKKKFKDADSQVVTLAIRGIGTMPTEREKLMPELIAMLSERRVSWIKHEIIRIVSDSGIVDPVASKHVLATIRENSDSVLPMPDGYWNVAFDSVDSDELIKLIKMRTSHHVQDEEILVLAQIIRKIGADASDLTPWLIKNLDLAIETSYEKSRKLGPPLKYAIIAMGPKAVPICIEHLDEVGRSTFQPIIECMVEIGEPRELIVAELLKREEETSNILNRNFLTLKLATLDPKSRDIAPDLVRMLSEHDPSTWETAKKNLDKLDSARVLQCLIDALKDQRANPNRLSDYVVELDVPLKTKTDLLAPMLSSERDFEYQLAIRTFYFLGPEVAPVLKEAYPKATKKCQHHIDILLTRFAREAKQGTSKADLKAGRQE